MKKMTAILGISILVIVIGIFSVYFTLTAPKDKGEFSVSDYSEEIGNVNFQTEKTYDNITDYKSAAQAGKMAISERLEGLEGSVFKWIGCDVQYDSENDAYYVRTYDISPVPVSGGSYGVIMKSDGTVLAIWGEK